MAQSLNLTIDAGEKYNQDCESCLQRFSRHPELTLATVRDLAAKHPNMTKAAGTAAFVGGGAIAAPAMAAGVLGILGLAGAAPLGGTSPLSALKAAFHSFHCRCDCCWSLAVCLRRAGPPGWPYRISSECSCSSRGGSFSPNTPRQRSGEGQCDERCMQRGRWK